MQVFPLALALSLSLLSTLATGAESGKPLNDGIEHRSTLYDGFLSGGDQGELSTFVDLMNQLFGQEALQRIFGGEESFTLFAPTNAAFEEHLATLSEDELAELEDLNSGALQRLLYYHITRGAWARPTGALRMLDDSVAQTYREGRDFKIEQATVLDQARYRNGIVATIDHVLPEAARALVQVNFLNCTDEKVLFDVYGGGDIFCLVPSSIAGVDAHGGTNSVFCNDTKRGCQIRKASQSSPGSCGHFVYAKEGQTVVVRPFTAPSVWTGTVVCSDLP